MLPFSAPGLVDTELIRKFPEQVRASVMESIVPKLLVGHMGTPEEVAEAYIFAMKVRLLHIRFR